MAEEILNRSAAFFESRLHGSGAGGRVLTRLARVGVEPKVVRAFGVGYAPGDVRELLAHLRESGFDDDELVGAGIAKHSEREHLHVLFHARVMFPMRDSDGQLSGFAGLATHLGPSWPLWVTSPASETYDPGTALFGMDIAAQAIRERQRALVKRDCVEVLRLHQNDRSEAVGVILSPITAGHLRAIAESMGLTSRDVTVVRNSTLDAVVVAPDGADVAADDFGGVDRRYGAVPIGTTIRSDWVDEEPEGEPVALEPERRTGARVPVYVAGIAIGAGIPLGTLFLAAPDVEEGRGGATPAMNAVIAGVALSYLMLIIVVARISARHRDRSTGRRMRLPWYRGSGEVQPSGWTYHHLEEVLVGAALVSALVCLVLWMTVGGFLG